MRWRDADTAEIESFPTDMPGHDRETNSRRFHALGATVVLGASLAVISGGAAAARASDYAAPRMAAAPPAGPPATHAAGRTEAVGLPQDAGPHDASAIIEWWYFNSFLTTGGGHHYAVVGSFFRTGVPLARKGHYLIYSLIDLDAHLDASYSILDRAELTLLKFYLGLSAARDASDPRPQELLGQLQREEIPAPHRVAGQNALVKTGPLFSISMENNLMDQVSPDARTWKVNLSGDAWTLDLTFDQKDRPPMRVGGSGKTGLHTPEDMYYLSLTRMSVAGTLTQDGVVDKVTGPGWIDRQWGSSWAAGNNGWDWFGLQLDDGSDLIVYRVRDNHTGRVLRSDATLLTKEGVQSVDSAPVLLNGSSFLPSVSGMTAFPLTATGTNATVAAAPAVSKSLSWTDPVTSIAYPLTWSLAMPKLDLQLTTTSVFPEQVIPVLGMGDAIWEGAVNVTGVRAGKPVTGHGFMELVGYKPGVRAKNTSHAQENP